MSQVFKPIYLDDLPYPNVLQPIDIETTLSQIKTELLNHFDENHPIHQALTLESEPVNKVLQVLAYRLSLKVEHINQSARSLMLAFATDSDLDHIGVTYYRLERKLIQAEDKTINPPKPAIFESDDDYRYRLALSIEALTRAGSAGSYQFHALSASPEVFSVTVHSPASTEVDVYLAGQVQGDILSQTGEVGVSSTAIHDVKNVLTADDIRPLTDLVRVQSATAKPYQIKATIYVKNGLSPSLILQKGLNDLRAYLSENFKPSNRVATSRIIGALDVQGVSRIELVNPTTDVLVNVGEVAQCTAFDIIAKSEGT